MNFSKKENIKGKGVLGAVVSPINRERRWGGLGAGTAPMFWNTSAELTNQQIDNRTIDPFDHLKNDYDSTPFSGGLMCLQKQIQFDMSYRDPSKRDYARPGLEKMSIPISTVYTIPENRRVKWGYSTNEDSRKNFEQIPMLDVDPYDEEFKFSFPTVPYGLGGVESNDFSFGKIVPYPTGKRESQYIPIESFQVQKIPHKSDSFVVPQKFIPIVNQKKMHDFSSDKTRVADELRKNEFPRNDSVIDQKVSIRGDQLMKIDLDYSLPLWNSMDYFDVRKGK